MPTINISRELLRKLKVEAAMQDRTIKELATEIIEEYFAKKERESG